MVHARHLAYCTPLGGTVFELLGSGVLLMSCLEEMCRHAEGKKYFAKARLLIKGIQSKVSRRSHGHRPSVRRSCGKHVRLLPLNTDELEHKLGRTRSLAAEKTCAFSGVSRESRDFFRVRARGVNP